MIRKAIATDLRSVLSRMGLQASAAGSTPIRYFGRGIDFFAGINLSIRAKILVSLCIVILLMGTTNALLMFQVLNVSRQYDAIITNIATANSISGIKPNIDGEMWKIVAGEHGFSEGKQYEIIDNANTKLRLMMENTDSPRAKLKLDVILRSMQTLREDVDTMGAQIARGSTSDENQQVLENIRFVSSVAEEVVQDYELFEVQRTETQYQEMRDGLSRWVVSYIGLTLAAVVFSVVATLGISRSIYLPIKKLHDVTTTITKNDLQALVTRDNVDEITELGLSFNIMIGRIRDLLDSKIKEQEDLKKAEMRALQAQINPHFLYNTLDTIIWMTESKKTDEVVQIVSALASFFRISLSKGKDWITIGEEIERTRCYLTIQKMRYRDIMDYRIEVDERVAGNTVLKLVLQPLVENALYHGLKNQRQSGTISVRARQKNDHEVLLEVEDDGIGITPENLARITAMMNDNLDEIRFEHGFGLDNVNKRIKLYYGKQYGLSIMSEYQTGTHVSVTIPMTHGDPPK